MVYKTGRRRGGGGHATSGILTGTLIRVRIIPTSELFSLRRANNSISSKKVVVGRKWWQEHPIERSWAPDAVTDVIEASHSVQDPWR
jgi:hypothetical protein